MNIAFFSTPAIASWMCYTTIISCIIVLGAIAGHDAQRASNRSLRWIWIAAIGIITALSIAAPFRNHVATTTVVSKLTNVEEVPLITTIDADNVIRKWIASVRSAAIAPVQSTLRSAQLVVSSAPTFVYRSLVFLWLAVSTILIAGFVFSYQRMLRHTRKSRRAEIGGVPVRVSPTIGPAVVGLVPSQIVVPEWLCARPVHEQVIAVTHETEHVRAADPWLLVSACVAVALMPWNPALWYCLSRLRLAIEIDCDRRVLLTGVSVNNYGSALIDLSALKPRLPVVMPAFPDSHSHLERRLIAMTHQPVSSKSARRIAGSILAATILITACESRLPTSAEVEQMDVASIEQKMTEAKMLPSTAGPQYLIDDKPADAQTARTLKASEIGSMSVLKAGKGSADEIRITTKTGMTLGLVPTKQANVIPDDRIPDLALTQTKAKSVFAGLLIIDGVVAAPSTLNTLSPDRILSMEVLKSDAATRKYNDPRAANGVIVVTTRK